MNKKKLILIPSRSMDRNKKEGRNEHGLVRMAEKTRKLMRFTDDKVEVWTAGDSAEERKNSAVLLDIFHAYSTDLKKLKEMIDSGELTTSDSNRVGFVTTKMWNKVTGGSGTKSIWISTGVHDTVIGADPEFLLFNNNGEVIRANNVMKKEGMVGCDGAMAEIRPKPSTSPSGLVRNIKNIFSNADLTAPIRDYEWRTGCYHRDNARDYPMGGHIHVGNPAKIARMSLPKRELFFNVLNKIMDEMIAVPCIRLDGEMGTKRRTQCQMNSGGGGFGWFGEWRTCNGRLEHRTLSGMWLLHPSLAKCVIGAAKAVTDEVLKRWANEKFNHKYIIPSQYEGLKRSDMNKDSFSGWDKFPICKDLDVRMSSQRLRKILNDSKGGDITSKMLKEWHRKMKRLSTYRQYSTYIDGLKEILTAPINKISGWDRKIQNNWLGNRKFFVNI